MAEKDFTTLEGVYEMFSPSALDGSVKVDLGNSLSVENPFKQLLGILENGGRGVYNTSDMIARIKSLQGNSDLNGIDISKYITIWTTKEIADLGAEKAKHALGRGPDGAPAPVSNLTEIIGPDYHIPTSAVNVSVILSRSPFFNPTTRNVKKSELFLNSMPSTVLSQMVPFLQVEFEFTRPKSDDIQSPGLLKFLLGADDSTKFEGANKAMYSAQTRATKYADGSDGERDYMGMEAFTSPVTLTNPLPNGSVGAAGTRYTNVLDPFRPLASLEHVAISAKPSGAGYFCYKKANLTMKVHDRSRLAEFSDLLRPRVYTGVTIWLTYGWRAPMHGKDNAYFSYINENMMMREAYHIVNTGFSFDNVGQVQINLELFTKGAMEMRDLKITDNAENDKFRNNQLKELVRLISSYRQQLRLDPPEGINKEIRTFQILDAAETGEFPDMKANELNASIDSLYKSLSSQKGIDKTALDKLNAGLKSLYKPDDHDKTKFALKERYQKRLTQTVETMFKEVRTGKDPFLPGGGKGLGDEISKACDSLNLSPAAKVDKRYSNVTSFGKLFSVFALRGVTSIPETIDEAQIFFYNINESCGPISGHSIAEFPIFMPQFLDAFSDMAKSKGGEKITLEDFLALVINSQFLDDRSPGYGLTEFYKPYERGKEAEQVKDKEQQFENRLAAYTTKYGAFKKPVVEMFIECSHEHVSEEGQTDILQELAYSAPDSSTISYKDANQKSTRRIMRIHIYDKQTNAYRAAGAMLRSSDGSGFLNAPATQFAKEKSPSLDVQAKELHDLQVQENVFGNAMITQFTSNQQVKDLVSKLVPTIRFGSNGTTITSANLASKADPLLSTVQMIRTQNVKNTAAPNGAGTGGIPLRVIPASMTMNTLGCPLATMAQKYFIDFQTGTTLDNLYIVTGLNHSFSPGKFETQWTFGFADAYGVFEGSPSIAEQLKTLSEAIPKDPSP